MGNQDKDKLWSLQLLQRTGMTRRELTLKVVHVTPFSLMIFLSEFAIRVCFCVTHLIIRLDGKLLLCHLPLYFVNAFFVSSGLIRGEQAAPILVPFASCVIFSLASLLPIVVLCNIVVFCLIALVSSNWGHLCHRKVAWKQESETQQDETMFCHGFFLFKFNSLSNSNSKSEQAVLTIVFDREVEEKVWRGILETQTTNIVCTSTPS